MKSLPGKDLTQLRVTQPALLPQAALYRYLKLIRVSAILAVDQGEAQVIN